LEWGEQEAEAHRCVGRYLVEFSVLVADMRTFIEDRLAGDDPMLARLALGTAFADPITESFFAICDRITDLDEEEQGVSVRLRTRVKDAIKDRNDFAHGDWKVDMGDPSVWRMKPGRKAAPWIATVRPVAEIDAMSDSLADLRQSVVEFAWLCAEIHPLSESKAARVRDVFRLRNRKVLRIGRYADDWPLD
jgi:hypothetical protein